MRKNNKYLNCHPSFSFENVKWSSNYKIIKSGRSLDLAFQLGAMTRRDCHVASLLSMTIKGLTPTFLLVSSARQFLTPPFLLVSSARQSLTRFGHRFVTLAVRRYSLACKLTYA